MAVYRDYELDVLEVEYDIGSSVPDRDGIQAHYAAISKAHAATRDCELDVPYGPDPLQTLDIFPAGRAGAPIAIHIHGGYWTRGDKAGAGFVAETFNAAGAAWVPVNYRLAPAVRLDDIVADVRAAVAWVHANAGRLGGDPARIHVIGSSAGGHLTAMTAAPGWPVALGLPADVVKSACPISGLHDLTPFLHTSQKDYLHLDAEDVRRLSPMENLPQAGFPLTVAWGGKETAEFQRQSRDYAAACEAAGVAVRTVHFPEHNHFSLMEELNDASSPLTGTILTEMGLR